MTSLGIADHDGLLRNSSPHTQSGIALSAESETTSIDEREMERWPPKKRNTKKNCRNQKSVFYITTCGRCWIFAMKPKAWRCTEFCPSTYNTRVSSFWEVSRLDDVAVEKPGYIWASSTADIDDSTLTVFAKSVWLNNPHLLHPYVSSTILARLYLHIRLGFRHSCVLCGVLWFCSCIWSKSTWSFLLQWFYLQIIRTSISRRLLVAFDVDKAGNAVLINQTLLFWLWLDRRQHRHCRLYAQHWVSWALRLRLYLRLKPFSTDILLVLSFLLVSCTMTFLLLAARNRSLGLSCLRLHAFHLLLKTGEAHSSCVSVRDVQRRRNLIPINLLHILVAPDKLRR